MIVLRINSQPCRETCRVKNPVGFNTSEESNIFIHTYTDVANITLKQADVFVQVIQSEIIQITRNIGRFSYTLLFMLNISVYNKLM